MKNPFKKSDHTLIIAGIAIASVAAGALAYLFLSESGEETRKNLKKKIKEIAKSAASEMINKRDKFTEKAGEVIAEQHNQ